MKTEGNMGESGENPSDMFTSKAFVQKAPAAALPDSNPNHHIWNNNGTYWLNASIIIRGIIQERIRESLKTKDIKIARRRREQRFSQIASQSGVKLNLSLNKSKVARFRKRFPRKASN